jgi:ribonuclease VapC
VIVDTSALVAVIKDEPESKRCRTSLYTADVISMSAANLLEAFSVIDRMDDPLATENFQILLIEAAIQIEPVTEAQIYIAREAFARFGRGRHPAKLNFGDCFAYALSRETGEPLLFVGNDFSQTDIGIA